MSYTWLDHSNAMTASLTHFSQTPHICIRVLSKSLSLKFLRILSAPILRFLVVLFFTSCFEDTLQASQCARRALTRCFCIGDMLHTLQSIHVWIYALTHTLRSEFFRFFNTYRTLHWLLSLRWWCVLSISWWVSIQLMGMIDLLYIEDFPYKLSFSLVPGYLWV